jgi:hypothetical protein
MQVPAQCQSLADEIQSLMDERRDLQSDLQEAAPGEKPFLIAQIKKLNALIAAKKPALDSCISQFGGPPPPPPLAVTFTGTATITTGASFAPGPFTAGVTLGLLFDGSRTQVFIASFPPVSTQPFSTPVGSNVTTVTKTAGGIGSYSGGSIVMPLTLHFDESIDIPFFVEDSDLPIMLSTAPPSGSAVTPAGAVTLAGTGNFVGGVLGGFSCTVIISGTITPVP